MKYTIFVGILFLIEVVCFTSCNSNRTTYSDNSKTNSDYNIDYYVDTINEHVILSTVVESKHTGDISISTLELND